MFRIILWIKMDLALNNLQSWICHKIKQNQTKLWSERRRSYNICSAPRESAVDHRTVIRQSKKFQERERERERLSVSVQLSLYTLMVIWDERGQVSVTTTRLPAQCKNVSLIHSVEWVFHSAVMFNKLVLQVYSYWIVSVSLAEFSRAAVCSNLSNVIYMIPLFSRKATKPVSVSFILNECLIILVLC